MNTSMSTAPARPRWSVSALVLLRLSVAALVLLPLAVTHGEAVVQSWLRTYETVFELVADDFQLLRLFIDHEGADRVVRVVVMWKHIVFIGGQAIYPDPRGTANASTLLAHALQGPLVAILAAIAWPTVQTTPKGAKGTRAVDSWAEWAGRTALLLPLLAVLVLIDMPVVLAGELWQMVIDALEPGRASWLRTWKYFMQAGGRYALGLAAGMLAVQGGKWLAGRWLARQAGQSAAPGSPAPLLSSAARLRGRPTLR